MKNKKLLMIGIVILFLTIGGFVGEKWLTVKTSQRNAQPMTTASVQFVNSVVSATGTVTAQNQATLNFQTAGKLIYLPFREGDKVAAGQTIAKLDTYALQRQLTLSLNAYKANRNSFDQTQENLQDNITRSQTTPTYTNAFDSITAVNSAIARIADQSQTSLDNSVINVELANYALQLSTLTSPLKGIITREDVTTAGVNITPATTFTVADPTSMVFRANVPTQEIYYVSEGSAVSIAVDGIKDKINGTVIKIYPAKVTLANGETVYRVDIQSEDLLKMAKLDETGTVLISTHSENVALVPAWTVLAGKYIWVDNGGKPELKEVTVGKIHGQEIEITSGLTTNDKIIIDPKYISSLKYGKNSFSL